jgi:hypothetical protein
MKDIDDEWVAWDEGEIYCENCGVLLAEDDEHWCPFMDGDEPKELNFDEES